MDQNKNWIYDPALIEDALISHFKTTYTANKKNNNNLYVTLSNSNFPTLTTENTKNLFEIPNEEEIKKQPLASIS